MTKKFKYRRFRLLHLCSRVTDNATPGRNKMVLTTWLSAHPCTKSVPSGDNSNLWVQALCNANTKTSSERAPQWDCNFTTRQFSCTMIWEQHMNRPGRFSPCLSIMDIFLLFYWDSRILGLTEAELHFFLLSLNSYSELQILAHLVASEEIVASQGIIKSDFKSKGISSCSQLNASGKRETLSVPRWITSHLPW